MDIKVGHSKFRGNVSAEPKTRLDFYDSFIDSHSDQKMIHDDFGDLPDDDFVADMKERKQPL